MAVNYDKIQKLEAYLEAMQAAKDVIETVETIEQPEAIDETAIKTDARNRIIAGSGDKKDFFGSLSTEPTVTKDDLLALGLTEPAANQVIAERDELRSKALALIK